MPAPELRRCVIATRESRLALWQAHHVRDRLTAVYPQTEVVVLGMTTRGDQILDRPLNQVGGKGLFVKELENALADGSADIAVHSMKDVPMTLPSGFALCVGGSREDPLDALVSNRYRSLDELPPGAVVGTSSLRREAQIRARHPRLAIASLRGNVETRLRKLDEGQYAAIILAAAGLRRLGLGARIAALLPAEESLPAVGQGVLGIEYLECRPELAAWLAPLGDAAADACVRAERAFSVRLSGSCQVPLAGYAEVRDGMVWLRGLVAEPDGSRVIRGEATGAPGSAEVVGADLAARLLEQGAADILARLQ